MFCRVLKSTPGRGQRIHGKAGCGRRHGKAAGMPSSGKKVPCAQSMRKNPAVPNPGSPPLCRKTRKSAGAPLPAMFFRMHGNDAACHEPMPAQKTQDTARRSGPRPCALQRAETPEKGLLPLRRPYTPSRGSLSSRLPCLS